MCPNICTTIYKAIGENNVDHLRLTRLELSHSAAVKCNLMKHLRKRIEVNASIKEIKETTFGVFIP